MQREIHNWYSPALRKEMQIAVYGHYGFPLLMFPSAAADFLEYERFDMIQSIAPYINSGKCKVFSINSINSESWLNNNMYPPHKSIRHGEYNNYILSEVVPFIFNHCKGRMPIITTGVSFGALHAANVFFRSPDIFRGTIALSGIYDLKYYTKGYYDDNVYYNSPSDYLSNMQNDWRVSAIRNNLGIIIGSGRGDFEMPSASEHLSYLLNRLEVRHWLDIWGYDKKHDWPTWRDMLPYFLSHFNI